MGEKGDADVLLVHSPDAEEEFMAGGHGLTRDPVMHNDFVIVGPQADPADVGGAADAADALSPDRRTRRHRSRRAATTPGRTARS